MPIPEIKYVFARGERGIFVEVYFPKKTAYQGAIFNALRFGYEKIEGEEVEREEEREEEERETVKTYLLKNIPSLLEELKDYKGLFDPHQYDEGQRRRRRQPTAADAEARINMYTSYFQGWSMYEVDGVWFDKQGKPYEERTQLVRLMFRLPSTYLQEARDAGCFDVFRAILYWSISSQGHLDGHVLWNKAEEKLFVQHHHPWTKAKRAFVRKYFVPIAKEVGKWIDDCALFIFGYLVRKFAENVLVEKAEEKEIWVTSFFNLTLNVIKSVETQP